MKKIIALALALILCLGIAACSKDNGGKDGKDKEVKGEQQAWGEISVFVPETYALNGGSITGIDDEDPTQCTVKPAEGFNMYDYWWISVKDADSAADSIASTKEFNGGEDISVTAGDKTWTGCHYMYESALNGEIDCGAVSCEIDGVTYLVNFCGHAPESAEMIAVLSSIKAAE